MADFFRPGRKSRGSRLAEWNRRLGDPNSELFRKLTAIYGNAGLLDRPVRLLGKVLNEFGRSFGTDRPVFIVRSTGRVNMLGMHVDHRGGSVNPIAIKEAFFAVEPRDDDRVVLRDVAGDRFPEESFSIGECLPRGGKVKDWDHWCHDELEKRKGKPGITFSNYVRAAVLYFQNLNTADDGGQSPSFRGMNVMIGSNVPPAAGLSTSSCLVVASALAILHRNGITMDPMAFCEHCGWAEWYVGTRGGFGDHAAIRLGRCNSIVHMTSFPFTLQTVPFPPGYLVVLADSKVEARKQAGAKDGYNTPLAAYAFGLWLARKNYPQYAEKLQHLRDINPKALACSEAEVYRIIRSLPESVTRARILAMLPEKKEDIEKVFRSHNEPAGGYPVRGVCTYGIAECMRSNLVVDMLEKGDIAGFGRLISLHHDGDRVARLHNGKMAPEVKDFSDSRFDRLIADLESGDPSRAECAHIWAQPGGYNVSVPDLDMAVDIAMGAKGVLGAGLVGAGLGGSMVALVEAAHADALVQRLARDYYAAKNLPMGAEIVSPVGGAGILDI